jgi:hypothetical protein
MGHEGTAGESFRDQVEELYVVFRRYPARVVMPANCTCCEAFEDEVLASKPLRSLSSSDLLDYFFLAVENVGDESEFRHFLPRILELYLVEEKPLFAWQVLVHKLKAAECWQWPESERKALKAFFGSLESVPRRQKPARGALAVLGANGGK